MSCFHPQDPISLDVFLGHAILAMLSTPLHDILAPALMTAPHWMVRSLDFPILMWSQTESDPLYFMLNSGVMALISIQKSPEGLGVLKELVTCSKPNKV